MGRLTKTVLAFRVIAAGLLNWFWSNAANEVKCARPYTKMVKAEMLFPRIIIFLQSIDASGARRIALVASRKIFPLMV